MLEFQIKLDPKKIMHFVNLVNRHNIDVNVFNNRYCVDGKSILGLFGLDLSNNLKIQIIPKEEINLEQLHREIKSLVSN